MNLAALAIEVGATAVDWWLVIFASDDDGDDFVLDWWDVIGWVEVCLVLFGSAVVGDEVAVLDDDDADGGCLWVFCVTLEE